jgi:PAS domain S-box-containing protein
MSWLNLRQSLQTRLGVSTAATTLILSTMLSLLVGQISRVQVEERIERSLEELADRAADRLDQGMFERYRDINSLAILDPFRQSNYPNIKKRIFLEQEQNTYPAYAWIGLSDRQGKVIASTKGILVREQAALLDIATDAIFVRALDGTILFWNCGAERIYGWQADEVLGQNAQTLLNRDPSLQLEEAGQNILDRGEWRGELEKINKAGHLYNCRKSLDASARSPRKTKIYNESLRQRSLLTIFI